MRIKGSPLAAWLIHRLGGTVPPPVPDPPPLPDPPPTGPEPVRWTHQEVAGTGPFNQPAADRLIAARDRIEQAGPAATPVDWLDAEIVLALAELGIVTISDDGPVDGRRHQIVTVRRTADPRLADHIAATIRPGYARDGRLIRPQAVIAWTTREEA